MNKTGDSQFYVIDIKIKGNNIPFLPISKINDIRRTLLQKLMDERILNYKKITQKPIKYCNFPDNNLGYKLNIYNNSAKKFYNKCNCNTDIMALESLNIIPKDIELMRTKHCIRYALGLCSKNKNYGKKLYLKDEKGKKYPLKFDCKNCEMVILNP